MGTFETFPGPGCGRRVDGNYHDQRYLPQIYDGTGGSHRDTDNTDFDMTGPSWNLARNDAAIVNGKIAKGNLSNEEYQFFCGTAWEEGMKSICRMCGEQ